MSDETDEILAEPSERRAWSAGRHPVNIGHLVMGVALLGLAVIWALIESRRRVGLRPALAAADAVGGGRCRRAGRDRTAPARRARLRPGRPSYGPCQSEPMPLPRLGSLESLPVLTHPDLLAPPVHSALSDWPHSQDVAVVEIDPAYADTAAMSEAYTIPMESGANCVVVMGRRDGRSGSPPASSGPTPGPTSTTSSSGLSTSARRRSSPWSAPWRSPGWSTAGSPRSVSRRLARAGRLRLPRHRGRRDRLGRTPSKLVVPGRLLGELPGAEVVAGLGR